MPEVIIPITQAPIPKNLSFPDAKATVAVEASETIRDSFAWPGDSDNLNANAQRDDATSGSANVPRHEPDDGAESRNFNLNCGYFHSSDDAAVFDQDNQVGSKDRFVTSGASGGTESEVRIPVQSLPKYLLPTMSSAFPVDHSTGDVPFASKESPDVDKCTSVKKEDITHSEFTRSGCEQESNVKSGASLANAVSLVSEQDENIASLSRANVRGIMRSSTERPNVAFVHDFAEATTSRTQQQICGEALRTSSSSSLESGSEPLESFPLCNEDDLIPLIAGRNWRRGLETHDSAV